MSWTSYRVPKSISLQALLKDADEKVKQAAADALNKAAEELENQIKANMASQGIQERTGALIGSVKYSRATPKKLRVLLKSEVFAKEPKEPGKRNPAMKGRYKHGVPYGRIIEFSPHINKPFFYTAWYNKRAQIKKQVIEAIGKEWSSL